MKFFNFKFQLTFLGSCILKIVVNYTPVIPKIHSIHPLFKFMKISAQVTHLEAKRILSSKSRWASTLLSRQKGNDQELIQSNSISCPKHQTGKGYLQLRRHQNKNSTSEKPRGQLFPNRWPQGDPK